eukprot:Gb_04295 [translate_table: standard]
MVLTKPYFLRMFFSYKYITANAMDRDKGYIVATNLSIERELNNHFECKRTYNAKVAGVVGDILVMRIKVEGLPVIYSNIWKELNKGFKNRTKI